MCCLLVVRTGAVFVVYPGARFTYAEGALHSTGNAPAFVARAGSKRLEVTIPGLGSTGIEPGYRWAYWWSYCLSDIAKLELAEESRWYDRGDIHRDFGPAVVGVLKEGGLHYWHKYDRGVLGAGASNAFDGPSGASNAFDRTSGASNVFDRPSGAPNVFACAPDAVLCSLVYYNANQSMKTEYDRWVTIRTYQTDSMRVIAVSAGARSAPNLTEPAISAHNLSSRDQAICPKIIWFNCVCGRAAPAGS
jgi:hypothetical protein